jgi:hypothetical protein
MDARGVSRFICVLVSYLERSSELQLEERRGNGQANHAEVRNMKKVNMRLNQGNTNTR